LRLKKSEVYCGERGVVMAVVKKILLAILFLGFFQKQVLSLNSNQEALQKLYDSTISTQKELDSFSNQIVNAQKKIIATWSDSNTRETILHKAARVGATDAAIQKLIKLGANTNQSDKSGNYPIFSAVINKKHDAAISILKMVTNYEENIGFLETALRAVGLRTNKRKDLLRHQNNQGKTLLYLAAEVGYLDLIKELARLGAFSYSHRNKEGRIPLHAAVVGCHTNVVEYFLEQKAYNINDQDGAGNTPLHLALQNLNKEQLKQRSNEIAKMLIDTLIRQQGFFSSNMWLRNNSGATPLFLAAKNGDLDLVKLLCDNGALSLDNRTNMGVTLENAAMKGGFPQVAQYLIDEMAKNKPGVVAKVKTAMGQTLKSAVLRSAQAIANKTLSSNASKKVRDFLQKYQTTKLPDAKNSPLHIAALRGDIEGFKTLVQNSDSNSIDQKLSVAAKNIQGQTVLHLAAMAGQTEMIQYLLDTYSLDLYVNDKDKNGKTPLDLAVKYRREGAVDLLFKNGAKKEGWDAEGDTELCKAVRSGEAAKVQAALQPAGPDAEGQGNIIIVDDNNQLEASKIDVNLKNINGFAPLHYAAAGGFANVARMLIGRSEIDLMIKNYNGNTPLHIAAGLNKGDIIAILLKAAEEAKALQPNALQPNALSDMLNAQNDNGDTPLHLAVQQGAQNAVDLLVKIKECDLMIQNKGGETPLLLAAKQNNNNSSALKILKEAEVREDKIQDKKNLWRLFEAQDNDGISLLHLAAQNNWSKIIASGLRIQCNFNLPDAQGKTPLHYAAKSGNVEIVKILCEWADSQDAVTKENFINAKAKNGYSAIYYVFNTNVTDEHLDLISNRLKVSGAEYNEETINLLHQKREALIESAKNVPPPPNYD
jgi:ankyrin repeat protein